LVKKNRKENLRFEKFIRNQFPSFFKEGCPKGGVVFKEK